MKLKGLRVAMPLGPLFEDLEYWVVRMRLVEEGALVTSLGEAKGQVYRSKSGGLEAVADLAFRDAKAADFDAIAVPGGFAPDKMRRDQDLLALVRDLDARGAPLGFICHAGWVAASARIIQGRKVTGSKGIKDDLENAGGVWVDQAAFRDGNRVWGRVVEDIPAYNRELVALFSEHWQGK